MNSVCRSFVLDTYGGVTAALKRAFALQPAVEDRSVQVVIEITPLGRRAGFWRLVSGVRKGGLLPIQKCERDNPGRFTKSGPDDSQRRFPRSLVLSISCGHIPGSAVPIGGNRRWTGATPPFLFPGSALTAALFSHAPHRLGGSLPSQLSLREGPVRSLYVSSVRQKSDDRIKQQL